MGEDECEPLSLMVAATAGEWAGQGTSIRERVLCDADESIEQHVPRNMDCVIELNAANPSQPVASMAAQSPIVNVANLPLSDSYQEPTIRNWLLLCVWTWICTTGIQTLSAGLFPASGWYYSLFHCTPDEGVTEESRRVYLTRWEAALRAIARSWKDTQSITASFLVVSALTILQLDDVLNSRAICTLMASAILLALASIISSFAYSLGKQRFISRWKTSECPDMSFWRCISMPLDFAIWSFVLFICTVFILIYQRIIPTQADATTPPAQRAIASPQPVGEEIVAIISVITACKIYHGLRYFYRKN
ncbi:hypothetical protein CPC08DRAFT_709803 [Agrocybe pediades]|nr:hypothetical protein CPC08DRAFT_709803 [Agrocybe pediades]